KEPRDGRDGQPFVRPEEIAEPAGQSVSPLERLRDGPNKQWRALSPPGPGASRQRGDEIAFGSLLALRHARSGARGVSPRAFGPRSARGPGCPRVATVSWADCARRSPPPRSPQSYVTQPGKTRSRSISLSRVAAAGLYRLGERVQRGRRHVDVHAGVGDGLA